MSTIWDGSRARFEAIRQRDPERAATLEAWADWLMAEANILPMTATIFRLWAKLMRGQPDALYEDAMLAATANTHGLTLATRNIKDFTTFGCRLFDPFEVGNKIQTNNQK